ncbi:MAG: 1-acyl-sn-glycerol-3-phosphate acyltransferase [Chitinophagaceae bacterium]|nr:1-acyl-sn-glycerol-3-phosphate acyltransferase [Chitinophagaceae bacterium]
MRIFFKIIQYIYSAAALLFFLFIMFAVFPIVLIAAFWGRVRGGNFVYAICRLWADVFLPVMGIFHKAIYEVPHNRNIPYIFVSNHNSYMDIPQMMKAIRKQPVRILAKAEMGKIPVFGFIYKMATVAVDRTSPASRLKSMLTLKKYLQKNVSIFICPEGTFNITGQPLKEFYDGAFKLAIETQTPVKPILFLDALDRLHYKSIFSLTPGKLRTVYLKEIPVNGYTLNDVALLKQLVYTKMEEGLIKYKASWIK